jgi:tetratricopeptide (TPR) repeat protein
MSVEAKNRGNAAFSAGKFDEAVREFTDAIELDEDNHILFRFARDYKKIMKMIEISYNVTPLNVRVLSKFYSFKTI